MKRIMLFIVIAWGYQGAHGQVNSECFTIKDRKIVSTTIRFEKELTEYDASCGSDVVIPHGVIHIGPQAFRNKGLISVRFPSTLKTIEGSAFQNNNLTVLRMPDSLRFIKGSAFAQNQIHSVYLKEGLRIIGSRAFMENKITSIYLPQTVSRIEHLAFFRNKLSGIVVLPKSIEKVENGAFGGNPNIYLAVFQNNDVPALMHYQAFMVEGSGTFLDLVDRSDEDPFRIEGTYSEFGNGPLRVIRLGH